MPLNSLFDSCRLHYKDQRPLSMLKLYIYASYMQSYMFNLVSKILQVPAHGLTPIPSDFWGVFPLDQIADVGVSPSTNLKLINVKQNLPV